MTTPLVTVQRFPDYTGENTNYYVGGELKPLSETGERVFILNCGPFYAETVEVFNNATGDKLKYGTDYVFGLLNPLATSAAKSSLTVYSTIELSSIYEDTNLPDLSVNYQYVGGPYAQNIEGLKQAVRDLESSPTQVYWDQIQGKPIAFPPEYHQHDAADIYGMDENVAALVQINDSIRYLADTLARTMVPEDNVVYGGPVKLTIDKGLNLTDFGSELVLQLPRSTTENGIVSIRIEYHTGSEVLSSNLIFDEHSIDGFKNTAFKTELLNLLDLAGATLASHDGENFLKLTLNSGTFPDGFIIVKDVVVYCDDTGEYNETYQWDAVFPVDGDVVNVPLSGDGGESVEYGQEHKINVLDTVKVTPGVGEGIYITIPNVSEQATAIIKVIISGLMDAEFTSEAIMVVKVDSVDGNRVELNTFQDGSLGGIYQAIDDGEIKLLFSPSQTEIDYFVKVNEITVLNGNPSEWQSGWSIKNLLIGEVVTPAYYQVRDGRRYTHEHTISDIDLLQDSLDAKVETTLMSDGLNLSPYLEDLIVFSGRYELTIPTTIEEATEYGYPTEIIKDLARFTDAKLIVDVYKADADAIQKMVLADGMALTRRAQRSEVDTGEVDEDGEEIIETVYTYSDWMVCGNPLIEKYKTNTFTYQLDLTALSPTLYYLVEVNITTPNRIDANNLSGIAKLNATYNLGGDSDTDGLYGSLFGEISYGGNSNLKPYYNFVALCNDADVSKYPFGNIYGCPIDTREKASVFLTVKGGGVLTIETDAQGTWFDATTPLLVGVNSSAVNITKTNGIADPATEADTNWVAIVPVVVNTRFQSL